jgi:hypothetical protein
LTRSPIVGKPAAGTATVTLWIGVPSALESCSAIVAPGVKPLASPAARPVSKVETPDERIRSFRPKNCEKPWPALVAVPGSMEMPLPPVAATVSAPLAKLAVPEAPRLALS